MKRRTLITIIVIAVIVGGLAFFKVRNIMANNKKTPKPTAGGQAQAVMVNGYLVKEQRIDNLVLSTGTVYANQEVELRPEASGRITHLYFKEGAPVSKGDLLVKLFDADLQAQLKKLRLQEELAVTNEKRSKELLGIDAVSKAEYDVIFNNLSTIRADMELINANISKTEIRAPFHGRVGLRNVSEGALVTSADIVATLQQVSPVRIDFTIPERYVSLIREKGAISFSIEGVDEVFEAQIFAIEPRIDENTRSVRIRATYDNKDLKVLPGAFAKISMPLREIENGIMIPTESVIPELKGQKVFISRNGKAFPQPIEIGMRNDTAVQVLSGLKPGDTVITTGIMQLRPESPLKISNVR